MQQKGINSSAIVVGHFNTPLSIMNRTNRQNINKEIKLEHDRLITPNKHKQNLQNSWTHIFKFTQNILQDRLVS